MRIAIECLSCGHRGSMSDRELPRYGLAEDTSLVLVTKRLVCQDAAYARTATIRMPRRSRRAEANKNPGTDAGVFAAAQRAALTPPHRYNMGTNGMNGSAGSISIAGTTGLLAEVADSTNSSAMIARPMPAVQ